jgi:hypothetical protein
MTNMPTAQKDKMVARPLNVLVPLIKEDLQKGSEAAQTAAEPYYRAAGEKMLEAKSQLSQGDFEPWIKRNFNISPRHARRYMSFARATADRENGRARPFVSFSEYMREEGGDPGYGKVVRKTNWHEPVKESIERARKEAQRIRDAELTRVQEREAERQLALRLIDIGYKVLAKELHPDKGGSRDAMTRLTTVRDRLKAHA